jgi:hypothetical protein
MMRQLKKLFSTFFMIVLFLTWVGFSVWMYFGEGGFWHIYKISGGFLPPDLNFWHSNHSIESTLTAFGPEGRMLYLKYQFRDFLYPFIYSGLIMGILVRIIKPITLNFWIFIPWFAFLADLIENYYFRIMVYDFPQIVGIRVESVSIATFLKWFFLAFSFVLIFIAFKRNQNRLILKAKRNQEVAED